MMRRELQVQLGERAYPIRIGADLLGELQRVQEALEKAGRRYVVITDENVVAAQSEWMEKLRESGAVLALPPGEKTKSVQFLEEVYDFLANQRLERSGVLIVFGGGVIGDLGGFAAASYVRGIEFIQIPTTLLAMVDSSVGGKTGINLKAGKNLVGAFHHPQEVLIDTDVLKTLPPREFSAGMAEVIKYGMLADAGFFRQLVAVGKLDPEHPELPGIIHRCCEIKAEIVAADEKETAAVGGRALLNLGHTFAHSVEAVAGYGDYLHGEAVGLGLVMAARLSQERGKLSREDVEVVRELVELYKLPTRLHAPLPLSQLLEAMKRDKKVRGGRLRFVGMDRIGEAVTWSDVELDLVVYLWREFGAKI